MAEQSDDRHSDQDGRGNAQAREAKRERRASHRVGDDQKSGQGSLSALSKLKMLERKRAQLRVAREDD